MSWGDVWVSGGNERPEVGPGSPKAPWVKAGVITREERAFIEAIQKMRGTRKGQPRAVDFSLQMQNYDVALTREDAKKGALSFAPDGLWLLIDVSPAGAEEPRYVVTANRVHAVTGRRNPPAAKMERRPVATFPLRAKAGHMGISAFESVRNASDY
ncbi:hypothetical protein [Nocardioides yefusunii]|uniref:Uncharacterized protein n=1 Tax=Nocardioides yefusunii TaxID=2500546 RepID=A0ABW1QRI8_9ACTN|nr:hypothetical protein [Nocardioides yefusunii]